MWTSISFFNHIRKAITQTDFRSVTDPVDLFLYWDLKLGGK